MLSFEVTGRVTALQTATGNHGKPNWLFYSLFASAVLTIGLTEFRPVLGGIGNLSDSLFLAAFLVWLVFSVKRIDGDTMERAWQPIRDLEPLVWGGIALSVGGAIASVSSEEPELSWIITAKYFITFCVWLPWVTFVLGRYLSLRRMHLLYIVALGSVALATLADLTVHTRFGVWLVTAPPKMLFEDLLRLRYGGPTGHPTSLGYLSAIGFLLSLPFLTKRSTRVASLLTALALLVFGGALLASGSRAALLGGILGWVTFAFFGPRGGMRRLVLAGATCLIALTAVSRIGALRRFVPVDPLARLQESLRPRRDFEADWSRKRDLQSAQVVLTHDPITGYGMDNVGTSPAQPIGFDLHNTVLQSWVAGGILAGLGTAWLYVAVLMAGWRALRDGDPRNLSLFTACVAFVTMDMFHPHLYVRFKWFVAALLIAAIREAGAHAARADIAPPAV